MARGNCGNDIVLVALRGNASKNRLIVTTRRGERVLYIFAKFIAIVRKTFASGRRPQHCVDNCAVVTVVGIHVPFAEPEYIIYGDVYT
jgi:hypothetical protein